MSIENMVLNKKVTEVKEFDELTEKRFGYERFYVRDFLDEDIYAQGAYVSDVTTESKISQKGNEYVSNRFRIAFYDDDDEMTISWFLEVFSNYRDGKLFVRPKDELLSFIQALTGDYESNDFELDFEAFRTVVEGLTNISFKVEMKYDNGYERYIPKFTRAE